MTKFINEILTGDNVVIMRSIPDNYVDLTVTSPPYDNLRAYNGFEWDFEGVAEELYRITKEGGVVVWVVGDATVKGSETGTSFRQALYFMETGFRLHDTMIYAKRNPIPLTHNRYENQFEYMFIFSKGRPNVFNPIKEETKRSGEISRGRAIPRKYDGDSYRKRSETLITKSNKIKTNIWFYGVGKGGSTNDEIAFKHPAIFPEQLAEDHITSWSNPVDLVFDPFGGSGTTAKMALLNGRNYLHIDISDEYNDIARKRVAEVAPNV